MPIVTETIAVNASAEAVFAALIDVEHQPDHIPEVVSIEFLTEGGFTGVGTRFRETRRMGSSGRQLVTELEVVECDPETFSVRMVADTDGTIWDTTMSAEPAGEHACRMTFSMDARGRTWFKRTLNTLLQGLFRRGIRGHMRTLRDRLEASGAR